MRILVANKFWYRRGGLERVMFDEIAWLEEAGHEVAHFSTAHPDNLESPWSEYFSPYLELGEDPGLSAVQKSTAAVRFFHNRKASQSFARLLRDFRPDIVHAHGIHRQISPSVLGVARKAKTPIVQSLHDYYQICPADDLLYRGVEPCEPRRCGSLWFGPCVTGRCVRDSLAASLLSALETSLAHARGAYSRSVSRFISPSDFMRRQMLGAGLTTPVDVIPNAVPSRTARKKTGTGFLMIGRVSREKGVEVALQAARQAGVEMTVAGDGPLKEHLQRAYPEVKFTGHLDERGVDGSIGRARAVVVPSLWFENAPMSVLEPMSAGVPVVASRIGGILEQVSDGTTGLLVTPGSVAELAEAMARLDSDDGLAQRLGVEANKLANSKFSPEEHLAGLVETYERCLDSERSTSQ